VFSLYISFASNALHACFFVGVDVLFVWALFTG
jgi:hypothetical protein